MVQTTAPRTAVKAGRSLRVAYRAHDGTGRVCVTLTTTRGRKVTCNLYVVAPIPSDFGTAFEVSKVDADGRTEEVYHTLLSASGNTCDCKGGTYCGRCKHSSALQEMRTRRLI